MTTVQLPLLSQVRIASPCSARWEDMTGDERTRHCAQCDLDVHNLSAMTTEEAEQFLLEKVSSGVNTRVCTRFFRRADGTILTRDCPVGVARWRRRVGWAAGRIAAVALFIATGGMMMSSERRAAIGGRLRAVQPFRAFCEWIDPGAPSAPPPMAGVWSEGWTICGNAVAAGGSSSVSTDGAEAIPEDFGPVGPPPEESPSAAPPVESTPSGLPFTDHGGSR